MVNKLYFSDGPPPRIDDHHWRPGIILGEPLTQKESASASPKLMTYGRAILVPGSTKARNVHGQLLLTHMNWSRPGSYQFWQSWGVTAKIDGELLSPLGGITHVSRCNPVRADEVLDGEDAYGAARRLLAEVLGVQPLSRTWQGKGRWDRQRPAPGDVVLVDLQGTNEMVPCVVVSSLAFNEQPLDVVVVLQCVEYQPGDEQRTLLLPLGDQGRLAGVIGQWSVSIASVRGLSRVSEILAESPSELPHLEKERHSQLRDLLEHFYA